MSLWLTANKPKHVPLPLADSRGFTSVIPWCDQLTISLPYSEAPLKTQQRFPTLQGAH